MNKTYNSRDARKNWRDLLDHVQGGGSATVTRQGKDVARIIPIASPPATCPDPARPKVGDRWGDLTPEQWAMVPVGAKVDFPEKGAWRGPDGGFVKVDDDQWHDPDSPASENMTDRSLVEDRIITHLPETK